MNRAALLTVFALGVLGYAWNQAGMRPRPAPVIRVFADRCGGCTEISVGSAATLLLDVQGLGADSAFSAQLVDHAGAEISVGPLNRNAGFPWAAARAGTYYLRLFENGVLRREYQIVSR
jgi:hypothetical protein